MAWGSQLGHGVLWLDINNLIELQPQTRFAVTVMKRDKKHDLFVNLLKHSQKHSPRQTTKCHTTVSYQIWITAASLPMSVNSALICPRGDLLSYMIKELSPLLHSTQSRVNSFSWNPPQNYKPKPQSYKFFLTPSYWATPCFPTVCGFSLLWVLNMVCSTTVVFLVVWPETDRGVC